MDPRWRVRAAWVLLTGSVLGWPISAFTFAAGEPPVVLGLSWFAITITALDLLSTQDVRKQQDGET